MRFSILGPLLAYGDDGQQLMVRRPAQRSTLAVLLLHASQALTKPQLIDALWGDRPPADADTALRVRMREVRRALNGHDRLVTERGGYRIVVRPGEVDADTFRTLAAHGRAALDGGAPQDAARLLGQACALWRDPPLTDLPPSSLMQATGAVLLQHRRDVAEWLIDARLALGQHYDILSAVRELIVADPLAEHPHVQLMLALYRSGQKSAALAAYTRLRDLTGRELGQDPGPEAQSLLRQILTDSPDLLAAPRPPPATAAAPGPAWTPLGQLPAPPPYQLPAPPPYQLLGQLPAPPLCQLPAPPPDFTGRLTAIEFLGRRMPAPDLSVTVISGPPGCGKTALAVKAGQLARAAFPDGQLFAALGGGGRDRTPEDALGALLQTLGIQPARMPAALPERAALYRSLLAGHRVLVVADDAVSAAQVRALLPGTAGSAVLVTSNSRLPDLEGATCLTLGGLSPPEGVSLLGKIAGQGRVAAESGAANAIVAACAGLPLALRIAGARLAAEPACRLADLAAAFSDSRRLLTELAIGDLSVSGRLDRAWRALDQTSRQALRRLAETDGRDLPDAVVMSAAGTSSVTQALADAGLIVRSPETGRYQIAPLARWHAAAQPA